ncbi:hypothetical protein, partial [Dyella nitratireducens]
GGDGNSYVRIGDDHYQVSYDKQWQGWKAVDPNRPHDFSKSVPVKLDGKGSAQALPKPGLKGGMDDGQHPRADKESSSNWTNEHVTEQRKYAAEQGVVKARSALEIAENEYKNAKVNYVFLEKQVKELKQVVPNNPNGRAIVNAANFDLARAAEKVKTTRKTRDESKALLSTAEANLRALR